MDRLDSTDRGVRRLRRRGRSAWGDQADRDVKGPVYVNVAASTEVPGPGSATTTIHDRGFVKIARYDR